MADAKTKEQLLKEWWDAWWEADYSWAGLAKIAVAAAGKNPDDTIELQLLGPHGERTLQEYWRRDPATGVVRDDAAMIATGELVEFDGTPFHIAHLPPALKSGAQTWKTDLSHANWEVLEALIAARIGLGEDSVVANKDDRALLSGVVLRVAPSHPRAGRIHILAFRAIWLGATDWFDLRFGSNASFRHAVLLGRADFSYTRFSASTNFQRAAFFGEANFRNAVFSGHVSFESAAFSGNADFQNAAFLGNARFFSAAFSRGASFEGVAFSGNTSFYNVGFFDDTDFQSAMFSDDADFQGALFTDDADFQRADFSGNVDFRNARFSRAVFRSTVFTRDANFSEAVF